MSRLIDADALKEAFKEAYAGITYSLIECNDLIDNAPTVLVNDSQGLVNDLVKERPTGEWIMNKTSARGRNYTCTHCNMVSRNKFAYCPKCGAKMKKEAEDEDNLHET